MSNRSPKVEELEKLYALVESDGFKYYQAVFFHQDCANTQQVGVINAVAGEVMRKIFFHACSYAANKSCVFAVAADKFAMACW